MQFPFRRPVNQEDSPDDQSDGQWKPPDYFTAIDEPSNTGWKPPDYFKSENEKAKPKEGPIDKVIKNVKGAAESIKSSAKFTKGEIDKFVEDTFSKDKESTHPYIKRIIGSKDPSSESVLPTYGEAGKKEPDTYWGGFRKGLYDEWVRPLASMKGVAGLITGEEGPAEESTIKPRTGDELPIRQRPREVPALGKTTPQQDAVAIALTKGDVPRTPANISAETGIPKSSIRRTMSELKKKVSPQPVAEKDTSEVIKESPKETPTTNLGDFIKQNPTAKMSEVEAFIKSLEESQPATTKTESAVKQPSAKFAYHQDDFEGSSFPMYNVEGGVSDKSSVSAQTLKDMGIDVPETPTDKSKFVNPFNKPEEPSFSRSSQPIIDAKGREIAPPQEESPTELPIKAQGTEFQLAAVEEPTKTASDIPIKRDILRDYTGEKFDQDAYDKARKRLNMGKDQSEWKPPDYFKPSEEPSAARTESGKIAIGADVKSLGKVLGTSLYKGDIAPIATKELLQNSIDATRHLGNEGKVDVIFDRDNGTIHVRDNGKGLSRKELESVFTDLGASGKRDDASAAGGFGLAKAAPLLGGKKVEVKSISRDLNGKLHEYSFEGTPDELLEGVDIKHRIPNENESTGTSVKVYVPENSDFYEAKEFVKNLSQHSPNVKSQIRIANLYPGDKLDDLSFDNLTKGNRKSLAILDSPSAKIELSIPEGTKNRTSSYIKVNLSNNGMYQGMKTTYLPYEVPNMPEAITVDIRPKVPEGHSDYPFTANREELRGTVQEQVQKYIDENIIKPSLGKRKGELQKLYNSMQEVTVGKGAFPNTFGKKIALYDPKGQITPEEMKQITSNPAFHTLTNNIASILDEAMKVAGTPEWRNRLEKVGIIFDDKLHGIHIPNPGSGKSAILINPFISMNKMSPDEASANILHTILHEMAHVEPGSPGHNEAFTIRLGDIYAKFGARRSVEAQDQILKSIANPNTGIYHSEIQDLLQTYKKSRGREATTEDLLSGTGIGSGSSGGGKGDIPPSNKSDAEGTSSAVNKLFSALEDAKGKVGEQEAINKVERARRFAAFAGVKKEGAEGAAKSLSKLRGEFDKVEPGEALGLNKKDTDSLFTAVKRARITEGEKARGYTALFKLMNGEGVPVRSELAVLDDVFGNGFANRITEMHGGIGAVGLKLSKIANTMKTMQNMLSLAAPLRHGIGMIARKEFYPAFADMFKFFGNQEFYDASMQAIEEHPKYLDAREAGLFLPKQASGADEEFLDSYIGNIPKFTGIPQAAAASKRAYTGFLNKLKFDTFDNMTERANDLGYKLFDRQAVLDKKGNAVIDELTNKPKFITTASKEAKGIANFINTFTGRGDLGRLNKMTQELNLLLWSPRMIASRIQMFTSPKLYMDLPKEMRMEGLKSLLAIAGLGTIIDTAASYAGAKVSTNILSTDFGKSRFGTSLIDPWGGFQQYVVAAARFLAGKTDSTIPTNRLEIAGRFLANKESPAASLAHALLTSKFTGKSDDPKTAGNLTTEYGQKSSVQRETAQRFAPIFMQDLQNLVESDPEWANNIGLTAAMAGASLAGMSQSYPEKKTGSLSLGKMKLR